MRLNLCHSSETCSAFNVSSGLCDQHNDTSMLPSNGNSVIIGEDFLSDHSHFDVGLLDTRCLSRQIVQFLTYHAIDSSESAALKSMHNSSFAEHPSSSEQCPLETPFSVIDGHYCCASLASSSDNSCEAIHQDDLAPCPRPPCKTNVTILGRETMVCPDSHKFTLHRGWFCCTTETAPSSCGGGPLEQDSSKSCCLNADLKVCEASRCRSIPGERGCFS